MKKRALSLLLSLCMALSLLPAAALATEQLGAPTDLVWGKMVDNKTGSLVDMPGMIAWGKGPLHQNLFSVTLCKESGEQVSSQQWGFDKDDLYGDASCFLLGCRDLDDGNYYFTVRALGDDVTYTDGQEVRSELWSYTKPAAELHTVAGLGWDWPAATWTATDETFYSYDVEWFFSETEDGEYHSIGDTWNMAEPRRTIPDHYILSCGVGFYKFRVHVLSRDITSVRNSEWSAYSPAYHLTDLSDAVTGALAGITADAPDTIREELQMINPGDLKSAIMADRDGSGALSQLRKLEDKVGGPATVESSVSALPSSDVTVVGATLNELEDGVSKPTLKIGQPSVTDLALPETLKDCTISVKFSMDLVGAWTPGELQVPVRITLPVPSTINPDFLRIVHYPADGSTPEILNGVGDFTVTQVGGKNYATFVLTHFSDFALVDAGSGEGTDPDPGPEEPIVVPKVFLKKDMFEVDTADVVYTGQAQRPKVEALNAGESMNTDIPQLDRDYTVAYTDNRDVGTATITITGMGDYYYDTPLTYTFKITPKPLVITGASVSDKAYDGKTDATVTAVTFDSALTSDDYTAVAVFADAKAGQGKTATVTVTLKNKNYSLAAETFQTTANIARAALDGIRVPAVIKKEEGSTARVELSTLALPKGETFTFTQGTQTNVTATLEGTALTLTAVTGGADKASVTLTGESGNYTVTVTVDVEYTDKTPVILSGLQVTDKTYDGKPVAYTGTLAAKTADDAPVTIPEGAVSYQWLTADGAELGSAPVDAGAYLLRVTVDTGRTVISGGGGSSGGGSAPDTPPAGGGTQDVPAGQADGDEQEKYYGLLSIPFTISKASVIVTAENKSAYKGSSAPAYTVKTTGFTGADGWETEPTASCPTADLNNTGTYPIIPSGGTLKAGVNGNNYRIEYKNGTLTVSNKSSGGGSSSGSGGGSSSGSSSYSTNTVTVPAKVDNGKVKLDAEKAKKGDTVTLTVTPDKGYRLEKLTVTDKNGKELTLKDMGDGKFTFTMPGTRVEVKASFAAEPEARPTVVSAEPITKRFNDIKATNWYKDAVQYVYDRGMMNGMTPKNFEPAASTSRAMLVTILYRMEGEPETEGASFGDVADWMYYANSVAWATEKGLVTGHVDGSFRPDQELTREQLVVILYRYARLKGYDTAKGKKSADFTDKAIIEPYAQEAVEWAASIGLVNGYQDGSFRPTGTAARAEVAAILMRFCQDVAKIED